MSSKLKLFVTILFLGINFFVDASFFSSYGSGSNNSNKKKSKKSEAVTQARLISDQENVLHATLISASEEINIQKKLELPPMFGDAPVRTLNINLKHIVTWDESPTKAFRDGVDTCFNEHFLENLSEQKLKLVHVNDLTRYANMHHDKALQGYDQKQIERVAFWAGVATVTIFYVSGKMTWYVINRCFDR